MHSAKEPLNKELETFDPQVLKKTEVQEKNPLPTADGRHTFPTKQTFYFPAMLLLHCVHFFGPDVHFRFS
uniref:Thymosin beta n=1 Tax=Sander lucioperca TaxID=283035 RepID=A0A8C9ZU40_SANLU